VKNRLIVIGCILVIAGYVVATDLSFRFQEVETTGGGSLEINFIKPNFTLLSIGLFMAISGGVICVYWLYINYWEHVTTILPWPRRVSATSA